jgi:hypothetical protein
MKENGKKREDGLKEMKMEKWASFEEAGRKTVMNVSLVRG